VVVHADRYNGLSGNTASGRSGPSNMRESLLGTLLRKKLVHQLRIR
jgi:hypothetical protein